MSNHVSTACYNILLALIFGPRHGYALIQAIEEANEGRYTLRPGFLYTNLAKMLEDGWVEETASPASNTDARRRYYRLSGKGRQVLAQETAHRAHLGALAQRGLAGAFA